MHISNRSCHSIGMGCKSIEERRQRREVGVGATGADIGESGDRAKRGREVEGSSGSLGPVYIG